MFEHLLANAREPGPVWPFPLGAQMPTPVGPVSVAVPGAQLVTGDFPVHGSYLVTKLRRFMPIAKSVAAMSKDTSTKVGAIALGDGFEIRSTGWNGAPRNCQADMDARRERPAKYSWFAHAEQNLIAQAARVGTPLNGCTMVVTHAPCMTCARLIVQAGITVVVAQAPDGEFLARWTEEFELTKRLFKECRVDLWLLEGESANQS